MEHRWSNRRGAALGVRLSHAGRALGFARVCDLSEEGVGVEVDGAFPRIERGRTVAIELGGRPLTGGTLRVPAVVMHQSARRLGLMFVSHDPELGAALSSLLGATSAANRGPVRRAG